MSSKIGNDTTGTAAWRLSAWSAFAFAIGTALAFLFLQNFLANDIQSRADSWLSGELGVLADVAEHTPADQLHTAFVREVAELASREVPHDTPGAMDRGVFFIGLSPAGTLKYYTGDGATAQTAATVANAGIMPGHPRTVLVAGFPIPFRVASYSLANDDRIYLALSTSYERTVLHRLRVRFAVLWCGIIGLGTLIVFLSTQRMLRRVELITLTAAQIGRGNLAKRVPVSSRNDEISRLSSTLNEMLDRVELAVQQLHTITDSVAHDLRSPLTSMRGKLELALMSDQPGVQEEAIAWSIDQLDRLSSLFTMSLDVAEAEADALRLRKTDVDLRDILRALTDLYAPTFSEAGIELEVRSPSKVFVHADSALVQRALANLLDNEIRHLHPGNRTLISLEPHGNFGRVTVQDTGGGFPDNVLPRAFERYVKGDLSQGHGLGLAFVAAIARSHQGRVTANNNGSVGVCITFELPLCNASAEEMPALFSTELDEPVEAKSRNHVR